jgi:hypothetical protein
MQILHHYKDMSTYLSDNAYKTIWAQWWMAKASQFSWDFLNFNAVCSASWEPFHSWANWDSLFTQCNRACLNVVAKHLYYKHMRAHTHTHTHTHTHVPGLAAATMFKAHITYGFQSSLQTKLDLLNYFWMPWGIFVFSLFSSRFYAVPILCLKKLKQRCITFSHWHNF